MVNVGKYTIHGSYWIENGFSHLSLHQVSHGFVIFFVLYITVIVFALIRATWAKDCFRPRGKLVLDVGNVPRLIDLHGSPSQRVKTL